ncbi:MAG: endolytic transglycosylase MltG [Firmicutes bacterium]|nr:endolytic transglycosylase MltG [Bacillota bacterium]
MAKELVAAVIALLVLGFIVGTSFAVANRNEPAAVEIPVGASTTQISLLLEDAGVINNAWLFRLYTKIAGVQGSLQAGHYEFAPNLSMQEVVRILVKGNPRTVTVTLREGLTLAEIADRLASAGLVNKSEFLRLAYDPQYTLGAEMPDWLVGARSLEGFLFPDTYRFAPGQSAREIILMMFRQFRAKAEPLIAESEVVAKYGVRQWVTLASIVEMEGKLEAEFPVIASVFLNRLERRMYLQSCATVQYALGERKPVLTEKDLQVQSPYNTYLHEGLPPGPIASPGLAALKAAANPQKTNYLYFVAKGDGSHAFSTTYSQHLAAKHKYESGK